MLKSTTPPNLPKGEELCFSALISSSSGGPGGVFLFQKVLVFDIVLNKFLTTL